MSNKTNYTYYSQYLINYLRDTDNPLANDAEFIEARAELAAEEFDSNCLCGMEAFQAQEFAMEVLMAGFD